MHVLSQLCSCAVLLLSIQRQLSTSLLSRRNIMLFRVGSTCSFFHVKNHDLFILSYSVLHRHLFGSRKWFPDHHPSSAVWSGTTRIRCWGGDCHLSVFVRVRFVMFCGNVISHGLRSIFCVLVCCFELFYVDGFGHCCAHKHRLLVYYFLFCLIGVVLATILVTTLACRRHGVMRVWSAGKTHCVDDPRT